MTTYNAANERIKRDYFRYLAEAKGRDASTVDGVAKSIARFEESTKRRDFKKFHKQQAVAFKANLSDTASVRTGAKLSKATLLSTLRDLRAFFFWLAHLPGYKSHIHYCDSEYFNLSDKDVAIARGQRSKRVPTLAQAELVLSRMGSQTPNERRNRALIAYAVVTGARASALASFRLGDVKIDESCVDQDARHVCTKFGKTFRTILMPVSELAMSVARDWHTERSTDSLSRPDDPLFPATEVGLSQEGNFVGRGLAKHGWTTSGPVREIFRDAFQAAGLPYFNPHSFRDMLVHHLLGLDLPIETLKALSQNLGHSDLMTTIANYGQIPMTRQSQLIREGLRKRDEAPNVLQDPVVLAAVMRAIEESAGRG